MTDKYCSNATDTVFHAVAERSFLFQSAVIHLAYYCVHAQLFVPHEMSQPLDALIGFLPSLFFVSLRLLQSCEDDSLNVAVPMRMLEVFSSERTYLPFLQDENYVTALIEQILHYMVQKGTDFFLMLYLSTKI